MKLELYEIISAFEPEQEFRKALDQLIADFDPNIFDYATDFDINHVISEIPDKYEVALTDWEKLRPTDRIKEIELQVYYILDGGSRKNPHIQLQLGSLDFYLHKDIWLPKIKGKAGAVSVVLGVHHDNWISGIDIL